MVPILKLPKVYKFRRKKDKEPFIIKQKFIASDIEVAMSELYHQANNKVEILTAGKEYEQEIIPYAYFRYKKQVWPIYNDDPGQQDMIYIDGEFIGAGAYNFNSIEEFMYIIDFKKSKKDGDK